MAIAVLILALARPLLGGWLGWRFSSAPDTVIIILDRSATMGLSFAEGNTCLKQAVDLVSITGKSTASDARIILIDSASLTPKHIPDWDVLSDLDVTEITQTAADIPSIFRVSLDYLLKNATGITEIWCLSDMQKSNWNPDNSEWHELENKFKSLSQPVTFRVLAVLSNKKRNRSISLVRLVDYVTADKKEVREIIFDIISDEQSIETEIPLIFFNNGSKRQTNVKIKGTSSRLRYILGDLPEDGKCSFGYIELPPDPNLQDNRCYFAYQELKDEKVLIICDDKLLAETFKAAVYPESRNNSFADIGFIIWVGDFPEGEYRDQLMLYLEKGGVAVFFPHDSVGSTVTNTLNPKTYKWGQSLTYPKDKPQKIVEWNHSSGPLGDTVSGSSLPLDSLKIYKRRTLLANMSYATALFEDGRPFLYRKVIGKTGKLYFCSTLPLAEWSDFGDGIILVPMLKRMMKEGFERFSRISYMPCGDVSQNKITYESVISDSDKIISPMESSGVYTADSKFFVVNRPNVEDMRGRIDKTVVAKLFKERKIYMFDESNENDSVLQTEVWRWFVMAMFCFLIAESILLTPEKTEEKK